MSSSGTDSCIRFLHPSRLSEIVEAVQQNRRVIPVGGNTKPPLSRHLTSDIEPSTSNPVAATAEDDSTERQSETCTRIDMSGLSGVLAYDPAEFTIRVLAGTPVQAIVDELSTHRQYLPMDPPRLPAASIAASDGIASGPDASTTTSRATIGGTVAAGISGPGRFRFGGVRDFLLGCTVIDGQGRVIRGGGHVVKNAAGFDLPKWMVGSCGRQGIMAELTLKVFPQPSAKVIVEVDFASKPDPVEASMQAAAWIGRQPWDLDALHLRFNDARLWYRIADTESPAKSLAERTLRTVQARFGVHGETMPVSSSREHDVIDRFRDGGGLTNDGVWLRMPMPNHAVQWVQRLRQHHPSVRCEGSIGGSVLDLACDAGEEASLVQSICDRGLFAMRIRGGSGGPWIGNFPAMSLRRRVARVMDPDQRFVWP